MPRLKREAAAGKSAAPSAPEFVVLRIGESLSPGATVTFVGAAPTMDEARGLIDKLTDSSPTRFAILEKKRVVMRRPAMVISDVRDSIAGTPGGS